MASRSRDRAYKERIKRLPRMPVGDPKNKRELVDAARTGYLTSLGSKQPGTMDLVNKYIELRDEKNKIEAMLKDVNVDLDAIEGLVAEHFERNGIEQVRSTDGLVSVYVEPYTSVQDPDALREWCIKEGLARSLTLPWQTVNSLTKQRLEDGLPEPTGVTVFAKTKFRLGEA